MDPIVIGRLSAEELEATDLEPLALTLVGYTLQKEEVAETLRFRPLVPAGAQMEVIRNTDAAGNVPLAHVVQFVEECVLEDDRERFRAFLHRPDVEIQTGTVLHMYRTLSEFYAARPTRRSSDSASGTSQSRRTSRANVRSAGSTSKRSRS